MANGGYLIADHFGCNIRTVSQSAVITNVAGTPGSCGFSGDGRPATSAKLGDATNVTAFADGGFLVSDGPNARVRAVSPSGIINAVAGNGTASFSGDGGPGAPRSRTVAS